MLEHLIPPTNTLKCPLCKQGVFARNWGFFKCSFLMLPRDGATETQSSASGWEALSTGTSVLVLMGLLSVASRGNLVSLLLMQ